MDQKSPEDMSRLVKCISRINKTNKSINAVISHYDFDTLLKQHNPNANENDLIFLLKDNMCTKDLPTTCASKALSGFVSPYDCTIVERIRANNGLILGKTNMDEFAMGTDNAYTTYGPVKNPLFADEYRTPGGSSGGAAASVAAGYCDIALGTDTGGSTRLPSSFCSVFGFKPSYGRISRYGVVSFAQSLDTVGIVANSMDNIEKSFKILDAHDPKDPTCLTNEMRENFAKSAPTRKLRIGLIHEAILDYEPEVRKKWEECLETLIEAGHEVVEVSVPTLKMSVPAYIAISFSEATSNLARYDGVRYGYRAVEDMDPVYRTLYGPTRNEGLGDEVQRRLLIGTFNLTEGAYDEHFLKAQKVRRMLINDFNKVLRKPNMLFPRANGPNTENVEGIDVFVNPTSLGIAHVMGKKREDESVLEVLGDVLTIPCNLAGLPAITVPVGKSIGMEVYGQHGDDMTVLGLAREIDEIFKYKNKISESV